MGRHTSTSKPRVKARTKSAARCNAPISVVSLHVYITANKFMNYAANRLKHINNSLNRTVSKAIFAQLGILKQTVATHLQSKKRNINCKNKPNCIK